MQIQELSTVQGIYHTGYLKSSVRLFREPAGRLEFRWILKFKGTDKEKQCPIEHGGVKR